MEGNNFEAKFGQLSDTLIHEKAPAMAPYKIGFQLVEKNDDETRAVGVMAYKIDQQWIYIPCFWLKGKLKGQNLMYLKQQDVFVPLNESWFNYIKNTQNPKLGEATPDLKDDSDTITASKPDNVVINTQYGVTKTASESLAYIDSETLEKITRKPECDRKSLLDTIPRLGKEAVQIFCNTFKKNTDFANAVLTFHDPDDISEFLNNNKTAAEDNKLDSDLTVITDPSSDEAAKLNDRDKEVLLKDNLFVEDRRKNTADVYSEQVDAKTLESPKETGVYEVLMADGSFRKFIVVFPKQMERTDCEVSSLHTKGDKKPPVYIIDVNKSDECAEVAARDILARPPMDAKPGEKDEMKKAGKALRVSDITESGWHIIIDRNGTAIESSWVSPVDSTTDPMFVLKGYEHPVYLKLTGKDGTIFRAGDTVYIPKDTRLIKKTSMKDIALGNPNTVLNVMKKEAGLSPLKIYQHRDRYYITRFDGANGEFSKTAAIIHLIKDHNIAAPEAKTMIKEASAPGGAMKTVRYLLKNAYSGHTDFGNDPAEFGDDLEQTRESVSSSYLYSDDVNAIRKASERGVQEVLDTSVLNALVNKSKSMGIVDDYLNDLVKSLDRVGRLMFLFYWHNDSFQERYGSQEMYDLETALQDVFESTSDLVLFLKEKTTADTPALEYMEGQLSENLGNA